MKKTLAVLMFAGLAFAACGDMTTSPNRIAPGGASFTLGEYTWDGRGSGSERCGLARDPDGWIHWVFSTKGTSTNAVLTLGGTGSGTYAPGAPLNANVWHFYTPYFDLVGLTATIQLIGGDAGPGGGLVISDFCPGDAPPFEPDPQLTVTKDADATFDRRHAWSIAKSVDPEALHLYLEGEGSSGTATWNVDVTYEGSVDINGAVTGLIRISLGGNMDASIASVTDVITQNGTQTTANVACKLDDGTDFAVTFEEPYLMTQGSPDIVCTYSAADLDVVNGVNRVDVAGEFRLPVGTELEGFDPADYQIAESDEAAVLFGAPENEIHRYATVTDENDGFALKYDTGSGVVLDAHDHVKGQVIPFTYSETFNREDYPTRGDDCEGETIENRAEVLGDEGVVLDFATATLVIEVQCEVFQGETATGAGFNWSETGGAPNTWFEYTPWNTTNGITGINTLNGANIITGRDRQVIGKITGNRNGSGTLLSFALNEPWELAPVNGAVKIHPLADCRTNRNTYVAPGQFRHHFNSFAAVTRVANTACYGIHLDVGQWVPDPDFGP